MTSTVQQASLKELVERFRMCWEVWPEYALEGKERRQVGFQLELLGTHKPEIEHPDPGCPNCQEIFSAVRASLRRSGVRERQWSAGRGHER